MTSKITSLGKAFITIFFFFNACILKAEYSADELFSKAEVAVKNINGKEETMHMPLEKRDDGAWRFNMPKSAIPAGTDWIDVIIPAAHAKKGDDGFFITTTSAIGTFSRENGEFRSTRNYYAFFGMKTPEAAWTAIIKGLELEFEYVAKAKNGIYRVFPRFRIKDIGFPPYEDIIVDFYPMGGNASYADMARKYRNYQLDRGEVVPLRERIKDNPKLERMAKSILFRIQHGGKKLYMENGKRVPKDFTPETELPLRVACTFAQGTAAIRALKAAGCDYVDIHEVGWNIRGHDGRYPQLFPVEPALGGEEGLKETVRAAKECGYNISAHTNHNDAYTVADCWSEDYIAKLRDGKLMYVGAWSGGKAYTPCPAAIFNRFVKKDYRKILDLGFNGLHHVDVISAISPRTCFDPEHPLNRKEWTKAYLKIMKYAKKLTGGFTSECGFDHVIKHLDYAFYINHKFKISNNMLDRYVPIWQIVYHGIVPSQASYDDTNPSIKPEAEAKAARLRLAEFGGRPVFYAGWRDLVHIPRIKKTYDEYQKMSRLQLEFMEDHKKLSDDVYLTVYGDGTEIVTNYTKKPFEYKGIKVAPEDYAMIEPMK